MIVTTKALMSKEITGNLGELDTIKTPLGRDTRTVPQLDESVSEQDSRMRMFALNDLSLLDRKGVHTALIRICRFRRA